MILGNEIGFGCQVSIDEHYRGNGIFGEMLTKLNGIVKEKYKFLLCSVSDDNIISLKTHLENGWKLIDNMENTKFFIYKTQRPIL